MKRVRDADTGIAFPASKTCCMVFDFPGLLPEMRLEARSHMTPLTRHLLRLTSRDMLADDRAPPIPPYLTIIRSWAFLNRSARRQLWAWRLPLWERELRGARVCIQDHVFAEWSMSPSFRLHLACCQGMWSIKYWSREKEGGYWHAHATMANRAMVDALRLTLQDWLDRGRTWPADLKTCPLVDAAASGQA